MIRTVHDVNLGTFPRARNTQVYRVYAFLRLAKRGNRADSSPRLATLDRYLLWTVDERTDSSFPNEQRSDDPVFLLGIPCGHDVGRVG